MSYLTCVVATKLKAYKRIDAAEASFIAILSHSNYEEKKVPATLA